MTDKEAQDAIDWFLTLDCSHFDAPYDRIQIAQKALKHFRDQVIPFTEQIQSISKDLKRLQLEERFQSESG